MEVLKPMVFKRGFLTRGILRRFLNPFSEVFTEVFNRSFERLFLRFKKTLGNMFPMDDLVGKIQS